MVTGANYCYIEIIRCTTCYHIDCIHAGEETFPLSEGVRAVAFSRLHMDIEPL